MKNILVTPSFKDDLQRCQRLVQSAEKYVTGYDKHYLLIDKAETELFKPLTNDRVVIMEKESLLPFSNFHLPLLRKWWFSFSSLPVRGWIMQQLCKLAIAEKVDADAIVFADSDVEFIRPFDVNSLWVDGKLRLAVQKRGPMMYRDKRYLNWYGLSAELFELPDQPACDHAYIAQLNAFRRDTCLEMLSGITQKYGMPWYKVLSRKMDMSEFILYGCYVDCGNRMDGHWLDMNRLVHSSWFYQIRDESDVKNYLDELQDQQVAVHVQSNLGIAPEKYQQWVQQVSKSPAE